MNSVPHCVGLGLAQTRDVLKRIIKCLRTSNIMYTYQEISVQTNKTFWLSLLSIDINVHVRMHYYYKFISPAAFELFGRDQEIYMPLESCN